MKKFLLTGLIAALLILPLGNVALAESQEASQPESQGEEYVPGGVPAQTGALESMEPALHAVLMAMLNHNAASFDTSDTALAWESLYNMLSLYGQLDDRSQYQGEDLLVPSETVRDYAAALVDSFDTLGPLPEFLTDRLTCDAASDSYLVVCGNDSLAEIQIRSTQNSGGTLSVTGDLVYLVDGSSLAQFQAVLSPQDNMFGYAVTQLSLT